MPPLHSLALGALAPSPTALVGDPGSPPGSGSIATGVPLRPPRRPLATPVRECAPPLSLSAHQPAWVVAASCQFARNDRVQHGKARRTALTPAVDEDCGRSFHLQLVTSCLIVCKPGDAGAVGHTCRERRGIRDPRADGIS